MTDHRVTCTACGHFKQGRCHKAQAAGLHPDKYRPGTAEVGPYLAKLPQHCPAFNQPARAK